MYAPGQESPIKPVKLTAWINRVAQTDIHICLFEHQVAFNDHFFGHLRAQPASKHIRRPGKDVLIHAERMKGNVGREHQGLFGQNGPQRIFIDFKNTGPAGEFTGIALGNQRGQTDFKAINTKSQKGRTGMVGTSGVGGSGIDTVIGAFGMWAIVKRDAPVLDHAAFGEDDDLAAAQDFLGQKGQQPFIIVGHPAQRTQIA